MRKILLWKMCNPYEKVCLKCDYFVLAKAIYSDKHGFDSQSSHSLASTPRQVSYLIFWESSLLIWRMKHWQYLVQRAGCKSECHSVCMAQRWNFKGSISYITDILTCIRHIASNIEIFTTANMDTFNLFLKNLKSICRLFPNLFPAHRKVIMELMLINHWEETV